MHPWDYVNIAVRIVGAFERNSGVETRQLKNFRYKLLDPVVPALIREVEEDGGGRRPPLWQIVIVSVLHNKISPVRFFFHLGFL